MSTPLLPDQVRGPGKYHPPGKPLGWTIDAFFPYDVLNPNCVAVTAQLSVFAFVWDPLI